MAETNISHNIGWGKPRLFIKKSGETKWEELPTPVENSTELQPTKGEKKEAKIEGGQNEDVMYKRSTYAVVYNIRKKKARKTPIPHVDGVARDHYSFALQPEDPNCDGFKIDDTMVTVDDTFTAEDGAIWAIQHDAIAPEAADENTVKWGKVDFNNGTLTFTESTDIESDAGV